MVALTGSDIAVKRRGKPVLKDRTSDILLGGRARFDDRISIYRLTEEGIPLTAIVKFVSSVPMLKDEQVLAKIIGLSERTLHRRLKTPDEPLNPEQSARAVRFAQVLSKAQEVFGSSEQAQDWMAKPVMALDGHKPVDLLTNPIGFELVDEFLTRLEYGVYQ
ncbi:MULTISPECIES: antitoxin Xre/MbcA/ParS toxin-binding domain-containing protein [Pseudomonas]|uniref:DUF2384 domain-containing protein n=1 Tax=Pseudomonas sessilinigenes TaxID=658629 RepID=A0ABX8MW71_9PSED|nr:MULTISPECIES: antitoxin Xre/MbcA/ParS toxin-binding domain-containing protein [Pseudomonas]AZC22437.1 hypothetical protein C4K39_0739 [Pseudomonas sessilinigenes]QIH06041.1 DUF2384 domain-containing protein [Pseudomonas sp. BIOMIG1BAC]QXH41506.1 DUF2384 domain-containing protein [Pseudomonas sessilinigenes]UMZ12823.1 DUF2384 domain-containing protein [Pseudomonas sp. MPFS]